MLQLLLDKRDRPLQRHRTAHASSTSDFDKLCTGMVHRVKNVLQYVLGGLTHDQRRSERVALHGRPALLAVQERPLIHKQIATSLVKVGSG